MTISKTHNKCDELNATKDELAQKYATEATNTPMLQSMIQQNNASAPSIEENGQGDNDNMMIEAQPDQEDDYQQ